jgi:CHASE1-domain containing sensor protein
MPPREMTYWWWLDRHGLTRRQVDEDISLEDLEWVPKLDAAKARVTEMRQKQAAREARSGRQRGF